MSDHDRKIEPDPLDEGDVSFTEVPGDAAADHDANDDGAENLFDTSNEPVAGDTGTAAAVTPPAVDPAATVREPAAPVAPVAPVADSIELKSEKPPRNNRQYILLGVLALLIAALAYDFRVARPQVDELADKLDTRNLEINRDPEMKFTPDEVRRVIGFEPSDTFADGVSKVEAYAIQSGLPFRKHYLYVTYKPFKGEEIFYKLEKFAYEENEIKGNLIANDEGTEPALADEKTGMPVGMQTPAAPAAGPANDDYEDLAEPAADEAAGDELEVVEEQPQEEAPVVAMRESAPAGADEDEDPNPIVPGSAEWIKWEKTVKARDVDNDGVLSKDEMIQGMLDNLDVIDIDNNDVIDVEEIIIYARAKQ